MTGKQLSISFRVSRQRIHTRHLYFVLRGRMTYLNAIRLASWNKNLISVFSKKTSIRNNGSYRCISTGKKNSDTATVKQEVSATEVATSTKNWMSFGYDTKDEETDKNAAHSTMFFSVTLCIVIGGFFFTYMPDYQLKDWAQREGYLQLRHRERNGLPLIDPNYVDPSAIELASDEELGETEIII